MIDKKRQKASYRHKQEIMFLMLNAARSPKTRTRLLHEAMISWEQTNEYAKELIHFWTTKIQYHYCNICNYSQRIKVIDLYNRLKEELENQ